MNRPVDLAALDLLAAVRWVPVLLYPTGSRPLPHRFAVEASAWEAARAAAEADPAAVGCTIVRSDPGPAEGADDLFRAGILEGAGIGTGTVEEPTSWSAYVLGDGWRAILMTRERQAGQAAMALPSGTSAASLAGSGLWEVRRLAPHDKTAGRPA